MSSRTALSASRTWSAISPGPVRRISSGTATGWRRPAAPLAGVACSSRTRESGRGSWRPMPVPVMSASEVLTNETRERLRAAFGVAPTNVYAATETAGIASECRSGHLHQYEDLVIIEMVDADNRPVPVGETGSRLLVTVLFSRTQTLIRHALSDDVAAEPGVCPDGLPFAVLRGIEGREEETLELDGIRVHPSVFHAVLEPLPVAGWQAVDEGGRLRVLLARPTSSVDAAAVRASNRRRPRLGGRPLRRDRRVDCRRNPSNGARKGPARSAFEAMTGSAIRRTAGVRYADSSYTVSRIAKPRIRTKAASTIFVAPACARCQRFTTRIRPGRLARTSSTTSGVM